MQFLRQFLRCVKCRQILKLATYTKIKITILCANWQLFKVERIAIFQTLFCLHKRSSFTNLWWKSINICCRFDDAIEVDFLLGINIWGLHSKWKKKNEFSYHIQQSLCLSISPAFPPSLLMLSPPQQGTHNDSALQKTVWKQTCGDSSHQPSSLSCGNYSQIREWLMQIWDLQHVNHWLFPASRI